MSSVSYFEVYPNPATNVIDIDASFNPAGDSVEIRDATGTVVLIGAYTASINVAALPAGMYTLIYTKDGNKKLRRFVKN